MDDSPRYHATQICILAAETYQWDIFLRSHLDIMNDRFDRASDGSYAWAGRKTYLKELEQLGINTPDLLIGSCFMVHNTSDNHYQGAIRRIGRALAETSQRKVVVEYMFKIIGDDQLDLLNRTLIAYLLVNYVHHLEDKKHQKTIINTYKAMELELPDEIQELDIFNK